MLAGILASGTWVPLKQPLPPALVPWASISGCRTTISFEIDPTLSRNGGPPQRYPGESSKIVVDETIDFIKYAKQNKQPFLAVVWFGSPHEPYRGLPEDLALYDDLPESYAEREVTLTSNETGQPTTRPLRDVLRERFAEITAMDRAIGLLRKSLAEEGLRQNTLLWYCGDNGTPSSGLVASPFRGQKAQMYEGGIRVPGIIEWPARIATPRVSDVNAVTSDMLPTICALTNQALPARTLDGINLVPLIDGQMKERPSPIFFWSYGGQGEDISQLTPYIDPELQSGTTPLVKLMNGIATRNFENYRHPVVSAEDFKGPRVALDNDYKLVIHDSGEVEKELFNLRDDPAETKNLIEVDTDRAQRLERQMTDWQQSVLNSLTGADYR